MIPESMLAPLNGDRYAQAELKRLVSALGVRCAVETGIFYGRTTALLADLVDEVHGVEISPFYAREAKKHLGPRANVTLHVGPSQDVLPTLLPTLRADPLLLYLDAHWQDPWPLPAELEAIARWCHDRAVVVIDDVQVPDRPFAFDTYAGAANTWPLLAERVLALGTRMCWYHNDRSDGSACTGKLYAAPDRLLGAHLEAFTRLGASGVRYSTVEP